MVVAGYHKPRRVFSTRILGGFVVAIVVASAVWFTLLVEEAPKNLGLDQGDLPILVAIVAAHAVLLGLPLAALSAWRRWTAAIAAPSIGFAIGALPLLAFLLLAIGVRTMDDWAEAAEWVGIAGFSGMAGGAAFWFFGCRAA